MTENSNGILITTKSMKNEISKLSKVLNYIRILAISIPLFFVVLNAIWGWVAWVDLALGVIAVVVTAMIGAGAGSGELRAIITPNSVSGNFAPANLFWSFIGTAFGVIATILIIGGVSGALTGVIGGAIAAAILFSAALLHRIDGLTSKK